MQSRDRLLNAMSLGPVDHTPLLLRFWWLGGESDNIPFDWRDEVLRVEATTALGLDDTLQLEPPLGYVENYIAEQAPGVVSSTEVLPAGPGEEFPRLKKTYHTPDGPLQTVIKLTEDWPRGQDIHLFDDYNIGRMLEPLVKTRDDIPRLRHLLPDPTPSQLLAFRQRAADLRQQAQRLGVVLDGGWLALGDAAMWLCGMERILYGQMDDPQFLDELLETIFQWEMRRLDWLLEEGIDVLVQMAWYENTDFWTPSNYRRFLRPRIEKFIAKAHAHGVKFRYIMTRSWKPYCKDFIEMGVDCLTGVDPLQDRLDLAEVKRLTGGQICLMGGVNSAIMLSQWTQSEIRHAVDTAIRIMSPGGGFILYPVDAIFNNQPWENVTALIEAWSELR